MAVDAMGYELGEINQTAVEEFLAGVPSDAPQSAIEKVAERFERMARNHNTTMWQGQKLSVATIAETARRLRELL